MYRISKDISNLVKELPLKWQRIIGIPCLILLVALLVGYLHEVIADKDDLIGVWRRDDAMLAVKAEYLLQWQGFSENEIELANTDEMFRAEEWHFNENGEFFHGYNLVETKSSMIAYYRAYFDCLYQNRNMLADTRGDELKNCSREAFEAVYLDVFDAENFEELLERLAGEAANIDDLEDMQVTGSFQAQGTSDNSWYIRQFNGKYKQFSMYCEENNTGMSEPVYYCLKDNCLYILDEANWQVEAFIRVDQ